MLDSTCPHGVSVFRKDSRHNRGFGITEMKVNNTLVGYQVVYLRKHWGERKYRTQNVVKGLTFKTLDSAKEFLNLMEANRGMTIGITSTILD